LAASFFCRNFVVMQDIEPFYNWRHFYTAEDDPSSPFYGNEYSEFEYTQTLYNYYIHPQWDQFGSKTLYMKMLFVEYELHFAVIEMIGEWNDAIENDIMTLRRNITDALFKQGITKFIFITENVFNFHSSDDSYYEDWMDQLSDEQGWVVFLGWSAQNLQEFRAAKIHHYVHLFDLPQWRTFKPELLFQTIDNQMIRLLG
jgi:hypothetical protein